MCTTKLKPGADHGLKETIDVDVMGGLIVEQLPGLLDGKTAIDAVDPVPWEQMTTELDRSLAIGELADAHAAVEGDCQDAHR